MTKGHPIPKLCVMSGLLLAVLGSTAFGAGCGSRGGPGYRDPRTDKCVGWEALARVCGSPPTTRCTAEKTAPGSEDAAAIGLKVRELRQKAIEPRAGEAR